MWGDAPSLKRANERGLERELEGLECLNTCRCWEDWGCCDWAVREESGFDEDRDEGVVEVKRGATDEDFFDWKKQTRISGIASYRFIEFIFQIAMKQDALQPWNFCSNKQNSDILLAYQGKREEKWEALVLFEQAFLGWDAPFHCLYKKRDWYSFN